MLVNHPSYTRQLVADRTRRCQAEADAWRLGRSAQQASTEAIEPTASAPARRRLPFRAVTRSSEPTTITPAT